VRGPGVSPVDDLVEHGDNISALDIGDKPLAPPWDQLAPDSLFYRTRAAPGADVPVDELLGDGGEGAGIGRPGDPLLLGLTDARVGAVLDLAQNLARLGTRRGERGERISSDREARELARLRRAFEHGKCDRAIDAGFALVSARSMRSVSIAFMFYPSPL